MSARAIGLGNAELNAI